MPCSASSHATTLVNLVHQYANHPNQFKYPPSAPKPVVTTFSGESCTFGQSSPSQGWQTQFKNKFTGANSILFAPSFFVDPATFSTTWGSVQDGALNVSLIYRNEVSDKYWINLGYSGMLVGLIPSRPTLLRACSAQLDKRLVTSLRTRRIRLPKQPSTNLSVRLVQIRSISTTCKESLTSQLVCTVIS